MTKFDHTDEFTVENAKAGIDIHYGLRTYPMSLEELEEHGEVAPEEVPGISDRLRERARAHDGGAPAASADD